MYVIQKQPNELLIFVFSFLLYNISYKNKNKTIFLH